jgi:UPF0755 protein
MDVNKTLLTVLKIIFSIMVLLMVVVITVRLCQTGYEYGYRFFTETPMEDAPGEDILVQVQEGTSSMELAKLLEQKGLIRDAKLFYIRLKLSAYRNSIEPGIYILNTSMTPKEMMMSMSGEALDTESTEDAGETGTVETTETS